MISIQHGARLNDLARVQEAAGRAICTSVGQSGGQFSKAITRFKSVFTQQEGELALAF
jgi:hypothetical protein